MTKVYPNAAARAVPEQHSCEISETLKGRSGDEAGASGRDTVVLTVWKKSLLFNCNGFTVYDGKGNLVFRVDNYMAPSGAKGEIVLMDAAGKPLLTIRRKRLSLGDHWVVYEGEGGAGVNPRFSVRKKKHVNILNTKCLAHVTTTTNNPTAGNKKEATRSKVAYEIQGSYGQRCCTVYDEKKRSVAEMKQKEAPLGTGRTVGFGIDVFRLIVGPEMDPSVAMGFVILLDQMFS